MMTYRELNEDEFSKLMRNLIKTKGGNDQKDFLEALKDSNCFIKWIEGGVKINEEGKEFNLVSDELSENEFKDMPIQIEKELFEKWREITPAQACQSAFWGYITLCHIKAGKIKPYFLAGGLESIDKALASGEDKKIDDIVRTALRHFSGLLRERGNRTVYSDCSFGRAWWRCRIAEKVCGTAPEADPEKIMEVMRKGKTYWEELVDSVVSKNSIFGDESIRAALIWALSEKVNDKKSPLFTVEALKKIRKRIGVRLAWQELAVFKVEELKVLFEEEFLTKS